MLSISVPGQTNEQDGAESLTNRSAPSSLPGARRSDGPHATRARPRAAGWCRAGFSRAILGRGEYSPHRAPPPPVGCGTRAGGRLGAHVLGARSGTLAAVAGPGGRGGGGVHGAWASHVRNDAGGWLVGRPRGAIRPATATATWSPC